MLEFIILKGVQDTCDAKTDSSESHSYGAEEDVHQEEPAA